MTTARFTVPLPSWCRDPLIGLLMHSDGVDRHSIELLFERIARERPSFSYDSDVRCLFLAKASRDDHRDWACGRIRVNSCGMRYRIEIPPRHVVLIACASR